MPEFRERFFILTPTPTNETKKDRAGNEFPVYLDASGHPMMWSAAFPLPAIGSRVFVTLNGIGWAVVKGYFESCGYVGLMTLPTKPPKWLRDQVKRHAKNGSAPKWIVEGIGCEFGAEVILKRPARSATAEVAQ